MRKSFSFSPRSAFLSSLEGALPPFFWVSFFSLSLAEEGVSFLRRFFFV